MRWSIVTLVVVGIVAAFSAALLVGTLRADAWRRTRSVLAGPDTTIVVAVKPVPANAVLAADAIKTKTVARDQLPANAVTDPVQAIGRVTAVPLIEGQALTQSNLVADGAGPQLAATLPPGKRAVGVSVTDHAGLYGILYPGCMVDVMVAVRASPTEDQQRSISATLVENVQVLAVERDTVVTPQKDKPTADMDPSGGRTRRVTLLVDVRQARAIELAEALGTLSLAMRNPQDKEPTDHEPVSLKAIAGSALLDPRGNAGNGGTGLRLTGVDDNPRMASTAPMTDGKPEWELMVIRGGQVETKTFRLPDAPMQANDH